ELDGCLALDFLRHDRRWTQRIFFISEGNGRTHHGPRPAGQQTRRNCTMRNSEHVPSSPETGERAIQNSMPPRKNTVSQAVTTPPHWATTRSGGRAPKARRIPAFSSLRRDVLTTSELSGDRQEDPVFGLRRVRFLGILNAGAGHGSERQAQRLRLPSRPSDPTNRPSFPGSATRLRAARTQRRSRRSLSRGGFGATA